MLTETKIITGGGTFVTAWNYNSADLPTKMTYPDQEQVTYGYNSRMLLNTVTGAAPYVMADANGNGSFYDAAGRLTSRLLGNGLTQAFTYYGWAEKVTVDGDPTGQGGRLKILSAGSLQNLSYLYDGAGNIRQIENSIASETQDYEYDALDRLSKWTLAGVEKTYTYNSAGNLSGKEGATLTYGDDSHPHAVTSSGSNNYAYDANGNMTSRGPTGQEYTLTYDAEGRLVTVSGPSGFSASFTYDGDGRRVKQVLNGTTTYFAGNYYENTGTTITKYYYTGTSRIAMRTGSTVYYLLGDHLGSTSMVTDTNGALLMETRYKPFGEVRYATANMTLPTRYTFTGQYSDSYINLLWYGSRHYDPELGRFISPDSIVPDPNNPQAYDRYSYAFNNPVKYTDPTGHKPCWATNRYSCGLNNTDIWKLKHGSTDEQRFIENLLGTPTRHTVYVGGFMVPVGVGRLDQDEGTNRITNKLQWLIELIALLKDIGENFQPSVSEPNVHTYFSYDQYENGYVDNTAISVENGSGANVYVSYIIFAIDRPDHFDCTTPCGEFPIMSTASDYLATVKPGETADISMCSNCWASPGIVGFLPIANGQQVNIGIGFLVPAMTIPKFELQTDLVSWR